MYLSYNYLQKKFGCIVECVKSSTIVPMYKYYTYIIFLNWHIIDTIHPVITKIQLARSKLRPLLSSELPLRTKLDIRSRLTFSGSAWYNLTAESARKRLQVAENKCLPMMVDAPSYFRNSTIYWDFKWETVDAFIRRLATRMFERADLSALPHLTGIAPIPHPDTTLQIRRRLKRPARELITAPSSGANATPSDQITNHQPLAGASPVPSALPPKTP